MTYPPELEGQHIYSEPEPLVDLNTPFQVVYADIGWVIGEDHGVYFAFGIRRIEKQPVYDFGVFVRHWIRFNWWLSCRSLTQ